MRTTKASRPDLDSLLAACAALPSPRSQAEWRRASTAMRAARREARRLNRGCEAAVLCGGHHRRLCVWTWGDVATVYNGPNMFTYALMIGWCRRQHAAGIGTGRAVDGRGFAAQARRDGPVRLPDLGCRLPVAA